MRRRPPLPPAYTRRAGPRARSFVMLRTLLQHFDDDPQAVALQRDGGRAFVSQSLRPYLVAALAELMEPPADTEPPVVVVSAVALSEKVPDPSLRPHGFAINKGDLLDLNE